MTMGTRFRRATHTHETSTLGYLGRTHVSAHPLPTSPVWPSWDDSILEPEFRTARSWVH